MLSGSTNMSSASSMLSSASSVGYKGADERSKLKKFRVAILPNVVTIEVPTNIANQYANADDANYMQLLRYLGKQLGKTISDQVIGAIYPLQVLKVDDGEIYFNQGGTRIIKGSVYEVRQDSRVILDPTTAQHIVLDSKF